MIIGIAGPARSGKDTAADYLISRLRGYSKLSFADPIKVMLAAGLGLTHEQLHGVDKGLGDPRYSHSARSLMQTLGTDWGRDLVHPDIWVRALEARLNGSGTVIPDVRFGNEAQFVRKKGVLIVLSGRGGIGSSHESEQRLALGKNDISVSNNCILN